MCYYHGRGLKKDYVQAFRWFKNSRIPEGYYYLGLMHENGWGTPKNDAEAYKKFVRSTKEMRFGLAEFYIKGDVFYRIALFHVHGRGGVPKNAAEAKLAASNSLHPTTIDPSPDTASASLERPSERTPRPCMRACRVQRKACSAKGPSRELAPTTVKPSADTPKAALSEKPARVPRPVRP